MPLKNPTFITSRLGITSEIELLQSLITILSNIFDNVFVL